MDVRATDSPPDLPPVDPRASVLGVLQAALVDIRGVCEGRGAYRLAPGVQPVEAARRISEACHNLPDALRDASENAFLIELAAKRFQDAATIWADDRRDLYVCMARHLERCAAEIEARSAAGAARR